MIEKIKSTYFNREIVVMLLAHQIFVLQGLLQDLESFLAVDYYSCRWKVLSVSFYFVCNFIYCIIIKSIKF